MTDSTPHNDQGADAIERAMATLRRGCRGVLQFDEHFIPLKYVVDPSDGRLVAPVMVAMLTAAETILFVPEEADDSLQLLVSLEAIDGRSHPCVDRWRIYHGEPENARWAAMWIDMAKLAGVVIDGDALMRPCALSAVEPALCKLVNADGDALRVLCESRVGVKIESPLCVGVDESGMDVRARFDIVRVLFDRRALDEASARAMIEHMLNEASER